MRDRATFTELQGMSHDTAECLFSCCTRSWLSWFTESKAGQQKGRACDGESRTKI